MSFKYYVFVWRFLVCCGMKTTPLVEIVRAAWLEEVGLEKLALRRAGIQEVGWIVSEEACRGVLFGALWSVAELERH